MLISIFQVGVIDICASNTCFKAVRTYVGGKRDTKLRLFADAVNSLQDGKKITQKRIAEYIGMTARTIRRYKSEKIDEGIIGYYNNSLNKD